MSVVLAKGQRAVVLPHDAACGVLAGDAAGKLAAHQLAARFVDADQAADAVVA